jgi:hypothetical protein
MPVTVISSIEPSAAGAVSGRVVVTAGSWCI